MIRVCSWDDNEYMFTGCAFLFHLANIVIQGGTPREHVR